MELKEVPQHLLVLGGNYLGLEFGQMFRRFGSEAKFGLPEISRVSHAALTNQMSRI
jgi:hypothetical protein